ncbi:uncharacterized protein PSFLO_04214 [Pseudozyma flocculosa]|uniref:Uncharacterized protein n=1 Tax=Pseudozyma flocculosa TaxID=84751 RepID=A0A5C3F422_9BASI|nr:uncharacterized protein PSFLO_04214 [Pseudozyma flocculosa]
MRTPASSFGRHRRMLPSAGPKQLRPVLCTRSGHPSAHAPTPLAVLSLCWLHVADRSPLDLPPSISGLGLARASPTGSLSSFKRPPLGTATIRGDACNRNSAERPLIACFARLSPYPCLSD